jgi:predicted house-cleaning noncanonical NTP pyrophosphatase (MazG superfamily)
LGKLVRDNIPAIIEASGRAAEVRTLSEKDFRLSLHEKLAEEVAELRDARSAQEVLDEAADVLEVIRAIAGVFGHDFDAVLRAAYVKRKTRGSFDARLYLKSTSEDGESTTAFAADDFLESLESGPLYRFADWPNPEKPVIAAGVYTVWDGDAFVYVGFAGMKLSAEDITNAKNPKIWAPNPKKYSQLSPINLFGQRALPTLMLSR